MMIDEELRGGVLVLSIREPRLDAARAPAFKEAIAARIAGGYQRLVLDFSRVDFIDSSGLGAVVASLKRLGPGGALAVSGTRGAVAKVFSLTRMDRVFPLHETVDKAVAALNE